MKRKGKGYFAQPTVATGLTFSLLAGFLDVLFSLTQGSAGFASFPFLLSSLAVTIILFFLSHRVLHSLAAFLLKRWIQVDTISLSVAIALVLGLTLVLSGAAGLIPPPMEGKESSKLILLVVFAVVVSLGGYVAVKTLQNLPGYKDGAALFSLAGPLVAAEAAFFLGLRHPRLGVGLSPYSFFEQVSILLVVLLSIALVRRFRRRFPVGRALGAFAALILASALLVGAEAHRSAEPSDSTSEDHTVGHVILITVDTLRADRISAYNPEALPTPSIDRLAKYALVFTKALSPAPWTLPAMTFIMTGVSPSVHGATNQASRVPDNAMTLAEYMNQEGYRTAAIGDNSLLKPAHNLTQGFDEYDFFPKRSMGDSFGAVLLQTRRRFQPEVSTDDLTDLFIQWLRANRKNDFFLWLHYYDPHEPYAPPPRSLPEESPEPGIGTYFGRGKEVRGGQFVPSLAERGWIRRLYESEVRYVDQNIGALLEILDRLGLYRDSLIVLTSDHGEEFWEHGGLGHGHSLHDELLWVPLMIKLPGLAARGQISSLVDTTSLTPTLLELCGIPYRPDGFSAGSLVSLWSEGREPCRAQPIVSTGLLYFEDRESIIFQDMKYMLTLTGDREELYDLVQDQVEKISLVRALPEKVREAKRLLANHHRKSGELRRRYRIGDAEEVQLDEETRERLRSLGTIQ